MMSVTYFTCSFNWNFSNGEPLDILSHSSPLPKNKDAASVKESPLFETEFGQGKPLRCHVLLWRRRAVKELIVWLTAQEPSKRRRKKRHMKTHIVCKTVLLFVSSTVFYFIFSWGYMTKSARGEVMLQKTPVQRSWNVVLVPGCLLLLLKKKEMSQEKRTIHSRILGGKNVVSILHSFITL